MWLPDNYTSKTPRIKTSYGGLPNIKKSLKKRLNTKKKKIKTKIEKVNITIIRRSYLKRVKKKKPKQIENEI